MEQPYNSTDMATPWKSSYFIWNIVLYLKEKVK